MLQTSLAMAVLYIMIDIFKFSGTYFEPQLFIYPPYSYYVWYVDVDFYSIL